jgi:hypothetical protein
MMPLDTVRTAISQEKRQPLVPSVECRWNVFFGAGGISSDNKERELNPP